MKEHSHLCQDHQTVIRLRVRTVASQHTNLTNVGARAPRSGEETLTAASAPVNTSRLSTAPTVQLRTTKASISATSTSHASMVVPALICAGDTGACAQFPLLMTTTPMRPSGGVADANDTLWHNSLHGVAAPTPL